MALLPCTSRRSAHQHARHAYPSHHKRNVHVLAKDPQPPIRPVVLSSVFTCNFCSCRDYFEFPGIILCSSPSYTAYDMIKRLPGFVFDDGTQARGYAGTAGNILIDGQRPTAKTDNLKSILERIPATDVKKFEAISGNPRDINMEDLLLSQM